MTAMQKTLCVLVKDKNIIFEIPYAYGQRGASSVALSDEKIAQKSDRWNCFGRMEDTIRDENLENEKYISAPKV